MHFFILCNFFVFSRVYPLLAVAKMKMKIISVGYAGMANTSNVVRFKLWGVFPICDLREYG